MSLVVGGPSVGFQTWAVAYRVLFTADHDPSYLRVRSLRNLVYVKYRFSIVLVTYRSSESETRYIDWKLFEKQNHIRITRLRPLRCIVVTLSVVGSRDRLRGVKRQEVCVLHDCGAAYRTWHAKKTRCAKYNVPFYVVRYIGQIGCSRLVKPYALVVLGTRVLHLVETSMYRWRGTLWRALEAQ